MSGTMPIGQGVNSDGGCGVVIKIDVSDVAASVRWYREVLGFSGPSLATQDFAQLGFPGRGDLHLGLFLNPAKTGTGGQVTTFLVPDLEAAIGALGAHGVAVRSVTAPGLGVRVAEFADPDGNRLAFRQNP